MESDRNFTESPFSVVNCQVTLSGLAKNYMIAIEGKRPRYHIKK